MKNLSPVFCFIFSFFCLNAQTPCIPTDGGIPAGNDAPGCYLCGPVYQGSTEGYTATAPGSDGFPCGNIENNQFISIIADDTGTLQATILASNCQFSLGVQLIIYDQNFNPVSNCFTSGGVNLPGNVQASGLIPGETYWIMIDGFNGDICDILLTTSGGINMGPPNPPGPITATPDKSPICIGDTVCYSISPVDGAQEYEWIVPANASIIDGGGIEDTFVCVEYITVGGGVIRVTPSNACFPGVPAITPAVVTPTLPGLTRFIELCETEFPYFLHNTQIDSFGNYTFIVQEPGMCDKILNYWITQKPTSYEAMDTTLCVGECILLGDSCYFESTDVDIELDCKVITELNITNIDTIAAPEVFCFSLPHKIVFSWDNVWGANSYSVVFNGDTISGITQPYYHYTDTIADTVHFEVIPTGNTCTFLTAGITCSFDKTNSTSSVFQNNLKLFPNPTDGRVFIDSDFNIIKTEVFDSAGRKILETDIREIDLSGSTGGVYFLKIRTDRGVFVKKVVKIGAK